MKYQGIVTNTQTKKNAKAMCSLLVFTVCPCFELRCICGAVADARAPVGFPHFPRDEDLVRALHAFESQGFSVAIASAATPSMTGDWR